MTDKPVNLVILKEVMETVWRKPACFKVQEFILDCISSSSEKKMT